ncbi:hypothetical protein [Agromyces sp. GXQ0307]|uniref:hypothetical protein n=1 Tax=unclassified Agromyces TaxID=2639701 RepID=UPI00383B3EB3
MKLIPLPGSDGRPTLWVNPEHVAAVVRIDQSTGDGGIQLRAELKIEGMPLQRVHLSDHASLDDADAAWARFLQEFEG